MFLVLSLCRQPLFVVMFTRTYIHALCLVCTTTGIPFYLSPSHYSLFRGLSHDFHGNLPQSKQTKDAEEARERSLAKQDYENGLAERRRAEELVRAVQSNKKQGRGGRRGDYVGCETV